VTESTVALLAVFAPEEAHVDQYIQRENITLYRRRLSETDDPDVRRVLLKLLAKEEAKGDPIKSRWASRWLQSELKSPS
jgi:hypothetical protein